MVTKDSFVTKEIKVDQAYGVSADQEHIYERTCKDIVADAFAGYNGSILSYGQTGAYDSPGCILAVHCPNIAVVLLQSQGPGSHILCSETVTGSPRKARWNPLTGWCNSR